MMLYRKNSVDRYAYLKHINIFVLGRILILYSESKYSYCRYLYEGRSINKLQNGPIRLIVKIKKIRDIHFVENLILTIHGNFLMMMSLL